MRFEKKNLPHAKIRIKPQWILGVVYFVVIFVVSYLVASRRNNGGTAAFVGDFYQLKQEPGELSPITWREDGSYVAPNGMCNACLLGYELVTCIK